MPNHSAGLQENAGGLLVGALTASQAVLGRHFKEMDLLSRMDGSRELLWGCGDPIRSSQGLP